MVQRMDVKEGGKRISKMRKSDPDLRRRKNAAPAPYPKTILQSDKEQMDVGSRIQNSDCSISDPVIVFPPSNRASNIDLPVKCQP
jgi:hypothetical protein